MPALPDDFETFCSGGVSTLIGTRDARLVPTCQYAAGLRVEPEGLLTAFAPDATAARTLANLEENGFIAVSVSRIADHRTYQAKGRVVSIAPATAADREWIERRRAALAEAYGYAGVPARDTWRIVLWPCRAIRFRVEALFDQTPGPNAGAAVGAAARERGP